jgi:hypothetical protein
MIKIYSPERALTFLFNLNTRARDYPNFLVSCLPQQLTGQAAHDPSHKPSAIYHNSDLLRSHRSLGE